MSITDTWVVRSITRKQISSPSPRSPNGGNMDKFWRWMSESGHGSIGNIWDIPGSAFRNPIQPTKQMLIGYMMEYLDGVCPEWQKNGMSEKNDEDYWNFFELKSTTQERYDWLVAKINYSED